MYLDELDLSGEVAGDLSEGAGLTMRQEPHQVAHAGFLPVRTESLEHSPG
ncbi:hypothetical protein ACN6LA_005631 [Streptomyces sp. SAS_269]